MHPQSMVIMLRPPFREFTLAPSLSLIRGEVALTEMTVLSIPTVDVKGIQRQQHARATGVTGFHPAGDL